jgi:hypothetical protein
MLPPVIETVTGTVIVSVPSEIVIVVEPANAAPSPIAVAVNTPVDAGADVVRTATDAGETTTIVVSLLTAVIVPVKPISVTVSCCVPFTPPNAMFAGLALSGIGVGEGDGVGVGLAAAPALADAVALALAEAVAVVAGTDFDPPPPPQPTRTAKPAIADSITVLRYTCERLVLCAIRVTNLGSVVFFLWFSSGRKQATSQSYPRGNDYCRGEDISGGREAMISFRRANNQRLKPNRTRTTRTASLKYSTTKGELKNLPMSMWGLPFGPVNRIHEKKLRRSPLLRAH